MKNVLTGINNLDFVVDVKEIIYLPGYTWYTQLNNSGSGSHSQYIYVDYEDENIRRRAGENRSDQKVIVTIQYTKQ